MNGLQTLPQWRNYFGNPSASILGAINAIYPVGKLLGLFPSTWISDRYGRKRPMLVGFFLLFIGTVLQGAAQNVGMMIVSRFILGFGTAFLAQPSPILVTELAYPTQRGKITSLYNTFYVRIFLLIPICFAYIWLVLRCRSCRLVNLRNLQVGLDLELAHSKHPPRSFPILSICWFLLASRVSKVRTGPILYSSVRQCLIIVLDGL